MSMVMTNEAGRGLTALVLIESISKVRKDGARSTCSGQA